MFPRLPGSLPSSQHVIRISAGCPHRGSSAAVPRPRRPRARRSAGSGIALVPAGLARPAGGRHCRQTLAHVEVEMPMKPWKHPRHRIGKPRLGGKEVIPRVAVPKIEPRDLHRRDDRLPLRRQDVALRPVRARCQHLGQIEPIDRRVEEGPSRVRGAACDCPPPRGRAAARGTTGPRASASGRATCAKAA